MNDGRWTIRILVALMVILSSGLTACGEKQEATPVPIQPSDPIAITDLSVLFQESFENPQSGWQRSQQGMSVEAEYLNGEMVLSKTSLVYSEYAYARPNLIFDNFILEADGRWAAGAVGGRYGVMVRYVDESDYIVFYIGNDGRYTLGRVVRGDWVELYQGFSDSIDRNGGINRFHVEAWGQEIRCFINGQFVGGLHDTALVPGDIMVAAWLPKGADTFSAAFDNVVVAQHP